MAMRNLKKGLACALLAGSSTLPAGPPPPRDAGPQRFFPPAPRVPLYETPAPRPAEADPPGAPPIAAVSTDRPAAVSPPIQAVAAGANQAEISVERTPPPFAFSVKEFDPLPAKRGLVALHYPASNEYRIDLFRPALANLGGGYIGVGTDQNLTFIAWARSEYAWLVDFDPVSVGINRLHLFYLRQARDYAAFRRLWSPGLRKTARALVEAEFLEDPYRPQILRAFDLAYGKGTPVATRLNELDDLAKKHGLNTFHNNEADYSFLRNRALAGRIQAIPGDLRGTKTIRNVNRSARALGIPIRVVYLSNAEDYFATYAPSFRENFRDLPGDERSLIVRTVSKRNSVYGQPAGEKFPNTAPFHYNVQTLVSFKAWLNGNAPLHITSIMDARTPRQRGFSTLEKAPPVSVPKKSPTAPAVEKSGAGTARKPGA